jgi:hypothetical protein
MFAVPSSWLDLFGQDVGDADGHVTGHGAYLSWTSAVRAGAHRAWAGRGSQGQTGRRSSPPRARPRSRRRRERLALRAQVTRCAGSHAAMARTGPPHQHRRGEAAIWSYRTAELPASRSSPMGRVRQNPGAGAMGGTSTAIATAACPCSCTFRKQGAGHCHEKGRSLTCWRSSPSAGGS